MGDTRSRRTDWFDALQLTMSSGVAAALLEDRTALAVLAVGTFSIVFAMLGSIAILGRTVALAAVFAAPLLLIHGVLNPVYPITGHLLLGIPARASGLAFATELSLRLAILFVVAAPWLRVDRDRLYSDMVALSIPLPVLTVLLHSVVVADHIRRRIGTIHLAQQARGIDLTSTFFVRAAALPKVLVPLISIVLTEAEAKSAAQWARGFGAIRPVPWESFRFDLDRVKVGGAALLLAFVSFYLG